MGLDVRKYKFLQIVRIDAVLAARTRFPSHGRCGTDKSPFDDWLLLFLPSVCTIRVLPQSAILKCPELILIPGSTGLDFRITVKNFPAPYPMCVHQQSASWSGNNGSLTHGDIPPLFPA